MYRLLVDVLVYSAGLSSLEALSICGHELTGHLVSVSLLAVNVFLTLGSCGSCFCVGHSEQVISLDTPVGSSVAGNGFSMLQSFFLLFDSEKFVHGLTFSLSSGSGSGFTISHGIGSVDLELFFGTNSAFTFDTPESFGSLGVNWLLVFVLFALNSYDLSNSFVNLLRMVDKGIC